VREISIQLSDANFLKNKAFVKNKPIRNRY